MLKRIVEIGDPLIIAQCKLKNAPAVVDMEKVEEVIKVLNPLNEATNKLSGA